MLPNPLHRVLHSSSRPPLNKNPSHPKITAKHAPNAKNQRRRNAVSPTADLTHPRHSLSVAVYCRSKMSRPLVNGGDGVQTFNYVFCRRVATRGTTHVGWRRV